MKYSISYPSKNYITSKDRNAIEYMLNHIGQSQSMGCQPKGRTKYSIQQDNFGFIATIQKGINGDQFQVYISKVDLG